MSLLSGSLLSGIIRNFEHAAAQAVHEAKRTVSSATLDFAERGLAPSKKHMVPERVAPEVAAPVAIRDEKTTASTSSNTSQQQSRSGSGSGAADTVQNLVITDEIKGLGHDGDKVVVSLSADALSRVATPWGVMLGPKASYGYDAEIIRVSVPDQNGSMQTAYELTFSKNLGAGLVAEPVATGRAGAAQGAGNIPQPAINPVGPLSFTPLGIITASTADKVTMRFETVADTARAFDIVKDLATAETIRDAGTAATSAASAAVAGPAGVATIDASAAKETGSNPVKDPAGTEPTSSNPAGPLADEFAPDAADIAFLQGNITSYTEAVGVQGRLFLGISIGRWVGTDLRLDENTKISRTITPAVGSETGTVSYTISREIAASDRVMGRLNLPPVIANTGVMTAPGIEVATGTVAELASAGGSITLTYALPDSLNLPATSSGGLAAEQSLLETNTLGDPLSLELKLSGQVSNQSLLDPSRTDLTKGSLSAVITTPGPDVRDAVSNLVHGDFSDAFDAATRDVTLKLTTDEISRDGYATVSNLGVNAGVAKFGLFVNATVGSDHLVSHREAIISRSDGDIAPAIPPEPEDIAALPAQMVVLPRDGVSVRTQPSQTADRVAVIFHGTFVQPTGETAIDGEGQSWLAVTGPDWQDKTVSGWVAAPYLALHPEGAMDATGRVNPDLIRDNYEAYAVQTGDNLWDIARERGVDFTQLVDQEGNHVIDPSLIYPGDTVYIPGTASPSPVEAEPATPDIAQTSSTDSVSGDSGSPTGSVDVSTQSEQTGLPDTSSISPTALPSGSPGGTGSSGTSSSGSSGSGSGSGSNSPTANTPATAIPATQDTKGMQDPALEQILRDYQVTTDSMTQWTPSVDVNPLPWWSLDVDVPMIDAKTITATEAALLDRLGIDDLQAMKDIKDKAEKSADTFYAPPDRRQFAEGAAGVAAFTAMTSLAHNDGHNDAFRHTYWSALMTQRFGADYAEAFVFAHEGIAGNPAQREAMDLYNDSIGIGISQANPDASEDELATLVSAAIENGKTVVVAPDQQLHWSNQISIGGHASAEHFMEIPGVITQNTIMAGLN